MTVHNTESSVYLRADRELQAALEEGLIAEVTPEVREMHLHNLRRVLAEEAIEALEDEEW